MSEHRLSEIVIERPRHGMRMSLKKLKGFKKQLNRITEEATEDGLFNPYLIKPRNKSKYLSDHLSPLRGFLRSQVGQPWDAVYSQLCQKLDKSTMAGQHVIDHVWDYVELHVELIDGIPYYKDRRWRLGLYSYRPKYYVHPETSILCRVEKFCQIPAQKPAQKDVLVLDNNHYRRIDGIWYLITFEKLPASGTVRDVLSGVIYPWSPSRIKDERIYAASKRQCSKKEIRAILYRLSKQ